MLGDGVGWLKLSRLRKLMEDENYRNMILTNLNKSVVKRVAPDDHIQDVVSIDNPHKENQIFCSSVSKNLFTKEF